MTELEPSTSLAGAVRWFAVSYGVAIAGYIALNAAASRLLGPGSFGFFVIAVTAATLIGQFALLGTHRAGLREAALVEPGDHEQLSQLRGGVRAVCFLTLPAAGSLAGLLTWACLGGNELGDRRVLACEVALLVIVGGHQILWANYLRGFGAVRLASMLEGRSGGAFVSILQSILMLGTLFLVPSLGLAGALGAMILGYTPPVLVAWHRVAREWRFLSPRNHHFRDLRRVVRRDWRFATGSIATYVNANLEVWLAGVLLSRIDISLFGAAQRLSLLLAIPLMSIQVVFSPAVARIGLTGDRVHLERLVRTGATIAAFGAVIVWVPMLIWSSEIVRLIFGDGFARAAPVLLLLTVGSVANVATGLCGVVLSMTHHEGALSIIQWSGLLVRLTLGLLVGSLFGVLALALAASLATTGIYVAQWMYTRRRLGVNTLPTLRPQLSLIRGAAG